MKRLVLLLLLVLAGIPASAEPPPELITKDMALQAIAAFRRDPTSELGRSAAEAIMRFAQTRPDVQINLSPKVVPWINVNPKPKFAPLLLAAFIAGNTGSQLTTGVGKDDSVAGVEQMIETYRQLQSVDPQFKIPEVEKLIELKTSGKLRAYIDAPSPR